MKLQEFGSTIIEGGRSVARGARQLGSQAVDAVTSSAKAGVVVVAGLAAGCGDDITNNYGTGSTSLSCKRDVDDDGYVDCEDNCPSISNRRQNDRDDDGIGDRCDRTPDVPNANNGDSNNNGVGDCPDYSDEGQCEPAQPLQPTRENPNPPGAEPTPEICDGLDNDFDGSADEDNVCVPEPTGDDEEGIPAEGTPLPSSDRDYPPNPGPDSDCCYDTDDDGGSGPAGTDACLNTTTGYLCQATDVACIASQECE